MSRYTVSLDWDEDGCTMIVQDDEGSGERYSFRLADPEALYDHVKAQIGPWVRERDEARRAFLCDPEDVDESAGMAEYAPLPGTLTDLERSVPDPNGGYDRSDPKHPAWADTEAWSADLARKVAKGE